MKVKVEMVNMNCPLNLRARSAIEKTLFCGTEGTTMPEKRVSPLHIIPISRAEHILKVNMTNLLRYSESQYCCNIIISNDYASNTNCSCTKKKVP